jgi:hypothetical protein
MYLSGTFLTCETKNELELYLTWILKDTEDSGDLYKLSAFVECVDLPTELVGCCKSGYLLEYFRVKLVLCQLNQPSKDYGMSARRSVVQSLFNSQM